MLFKNNLIFATALLSLASALPQTETVAVGTAAAGTGGLLLDSSAIPRQTQAPTRDGPPPAPSCFCWTKHPDNYGDFFNISGTGLDPARLGDFGEGLLTELRHCGSTVTKWNFWWNGPVWWAQGWTVVWQTKCIANSAYTVGCPATMSGNCEQGGE